MAVVTQLLYYSDKDKQTVWTGADVPVVNGCYGNPPLDSTGAGGYGRRRTDRTLMVVGKAEGVM